MNKEPMPLINWQALASLNRPPMPKPNVSPAEMWDDNAIMYNQMAQMEKEFTLNQINAMPIKDTDHALDCGCGPGRITVPLAQRAGKVTAMDVAGKMLATCQQNVESAGLNNVDFVVQDFNDPDIVAKMPKFDLVICSRSAGLQDLAKLSAMSKGRVAVVIWANAPSIPCLLDRLFEGCLLEEKKRPMPAQDRRISYNIMYNQAYDLGYEPNISVVEDGFSKIFADKEQAYAELSKLRKMDTSKMDIFKSNVDKVLTANADGTFTYLQKTRSAVLWWDVNKAQY